MAMTRLSPLSAPNCMGGYWANPRGRGLTEVAPPASNLFITTAGSARTRDGFTNSLWNLHNANHTHEPLWVSEYNVTFCAGDNKLLYIDHDSGDAVYNSGLSLTAASQLSYYNGALYLTNTTDGVYRVGMTRVTANAAIGDKIITVEDGTNYRFPTNGTVRSKNLTETFLQPTSGTVTGAASNGGPNLIRLTLGATHNLVTGCVITVASVAGTTEANGDWTVTVVDGVTVDLQGSVFTNAFTGNGTWLFSQVTAGKNFIVIPGALVHAFSTGDLIFQTLALSSIPKAKKIIFWEEYMHCFGVSNATNSNTAKRTLFFGDVASTTSWSQIESFTGGKSGRTVIGKKGILKNALAVRDYLFEFTDDETYHTAVSDVTPSTGARTAHLFSNKYTTQDANGAAEMNGRIVFADLKNKRIIRSKVNLGGLLEPDELFDAPIRDHLVDMDATQSSPLVFFWGEANYLLCQISINNQNTLFIYDNNEIITAQGASPGRWLPPIYNWQFYRYFLKNGLLYATDLATHTIYQMAVGATDNGAPIASTWAAGIIEPWRRYRLHIIPLGPALTDWGDIEISGGLTKGTTATYQSFVTETAGATKDFNADDADFGASSSVGYVGVGNGPVGGGANSSIFGRIDKTFKVSPAKGRSFQPIVTSQGDGYAFKIDSWRLPKAKYYSTIESTIT